MNQLTMKQPEEHPMTQMEEFGCVVIGGGPSGATAAHEMARRGHRVLLLDRAGRIKPCGGAIPPRLIRDFEIPDDLLVARARAARKIAPSNTVVDMPGGENGHDVLKRYLPVVRDLRIRYLDDEHWSQDVIMVSHGAAIRLAAAVLAGVEPSFVLDHHLANTEFVTLTPITDGRWSCVQWGSLTPPFYPEPGSHPVQDALEAADPMG